MQFQHAFTCIFSTYTPCISTSYFIISATYSPTCTLIIQHMLSQALTNNNTTTTHYTTQRPILKILAVHFTLKFQQLHMPFQLSLSFPALILHHCSHLHALFINLSSYSQKISKKTLNVVPSHTISAHSNTFTCNSSFHMFF